MLGSAKSIISPALFVQRRAMVRVYSSPRSSNLLTNQLVQPKGTVKGNDGGFRAVLKSGFYAAKKKQDVTPEASEPAAPSWSDAQSTTDVMKVEAVKSVATARSNANQRPYVPLEKAAEIELKGDYFMEGGMHQEALQHFGVAATVYNIAYPENHNQRAGIAIKLGAAFRMTGRLESSQANLESALYMLDMNKQPSLELICECLMELGLTAEASNNQDAGLIYEDVLAVLRAFHSLGESHRMMRLLPRLGRRFNLNHEQKFIYFSPFDYDRTFAIADASLDHAENFYKKRNDSTGVIRVLTIRKELLDSKYFNMRDFAGRIRTLGGHWARQAAILTNAPTPDELLLYSPTIHQVHRDFRYENTAPIGRESEVVPGTNRTVLDDGNPYRKIKKVGRWDVRDAKGSVGKARAQSEWAS